MLAAHAYVPAALLTLFVMRASLRCLYFYIDVRASVVRLSCPGRVGSILLFSEHILKPRMQARAWLSAIVSNGRQGQVYVPTLNDVLAFRVIIMHVLTRWDSPCSHACCSPSYVRLHVRRA